jgi:integrase
MIEATKGSRNEVRDRRLLLLMFRHGLRVSEACRMKLEQVDTESRVLHVARLKGVIDDTAPTRRRTEGRQRMAERTCRDETDRQGVLCKRAAQAVAPLERQLYPFTKRTADRGRILPRLFSAGGPRSGRELGIMVHWQIIWRFRPLTRPWRLAAQYDHGCTVL